MDPSSVRRYTAFFLSATQNLPARGCVHVQLKILTWQNEEIASDALSIHGYEHYESTDYALAAWYPRQPKALAAPGEKTGTGKRSSDFTKWWADGDEPLYYIVSSKVRS